MKKLRFKQLNDTQVYNPRLLTLSLLSPSILLWHGSLPCLWVSSSLGGFTSSQWDAVTLWGNLVGRYGFSLWLYFWSLSSTSVLCCRALQECRHCLSSCFFVVAFDSVLHWPVFSTQNTLALSIRVLVNKGFNTLKKEKFPDKVLIYVRFFFL